MAGRVQGMDRVRSALRRLPAELTQPLKDGLEAGARQVAATAQQLAPVDEGDLRASIRAAPTSRDRLVWKIGVFGARALKRAPHAHWVEFGTVRRPAQPFLRPAWDQHRRGIITMVRDHLRKIVSRIHG